MCFQRRVSAAWTLVVFLTIACSASILADTVVLTDGTTLQGRVIKQQDRYWVKTDDGESHMIPVDKVQSIKTAEPAAVKPAEGPRAGISPDYLSTRKTAEGMLVAREAARLWTTFIDRHATSPDLPAAQAELAKWKAMGDAERIGGRWLRGADRTAIVDRANELVAKANEDMRENRALKAIEEYKEAVKIYPNDYNANFALGYLSLVAKNHDEAVLYFEQAMKLRPMSVGAVSNLAIALWETKRFERAITLFLQAAQMGDDINVARNLIAALVLTPAGKISVAQTRELTTASNLLNDKYQLRAAKDAKFWLHPPTTGQSNSAAEGDTISGTGFLISSDGLILTNRHVAGFGKRIFVRTAEGKQYPAQAINIDNNQDLAVISIAYEGAAPYLNLSATDLPNEGAQCYALGYPLIDRMGATLKITQGIVSGLRPSEPADILVDAKVNPGNSGGPLLDRFGQVMGIVTQKSRSSEREDSYGLAISAGKIRQFYQRNDILLGVNHPALVAMSAEEIINKSKSATVCIIVTRGGAPTTTGPSTTTTRPSVATPPVTTTDPPQRPTPEPGPTTRPSTESANGKEPPNLWGEGASRDGQRVIDLIPLLAPDRDRVRGEWRVSDGKLYCDTSNLCPRIGIPYELPEEYDLRVEWSQRQIRHGVFVGLSRNGHGFDWTIEPVVGQACGFNAIAGHVVTNPANPTRFLSPGLAQGSVKRWWCVFAGMAFRVT